MNKKLILGLLAAVLVSYSSIASAYSSDDLNKRLRACTPSKDYQAGGSTVYQISGLTGATCIFKIEYKTATNKPDLICKVPISRMYEMTSFNPLVVQGIINRYCVMSMKSITDPIKPYNSSIIY